MVVIRRDIPLTPVPSLGFSGICRRITIALTNSFQNPANPPALRRAAVAHRITNRTASVAECDRPVAQARRVGRISVLFYFSLSIN
jgi:hypothetical protein